MKLLSLFIVALPLVWAQESTSVSPTPTDSVDQPSMTTDAPGPTWTACYFAEVFPTTTETVELPSNFDLPAGAVCWEIYSVGGGVLDRPILTISTADDPGVTDIPATPSPSTSAISTTSTSSGSNLKVILPAVFGSLAGALFSIFGVLWLTRYRARSKSSTRSSRVGAWVNRAGWVHDEKPGDNIAMQAQGPSSKERTADLEAA
ncbi:hypothetical protein SISNIDRAFT_460736 [Sistotremastrum niveocremeum HHB9708]|uniref:Mid2 domain-containing protein n=1 Tax=Sistotremastrum niveocremeum HHB9708 TaxID=1314777 RepID=A0A164NF79_9AGAM|nr:hypothetical protein SISNIDRAFT_460736 [Sistotremastrum niveocremeum HHB9708]